MIQVTSMEVEVVFKASTLIGAEGAGEGGWDTI